MRNPFIETALLISMLNKTPEDISLIRNKPLLKGRTNIHTNYILIIKNVLSFSRRILSITFPPKIFTHSKQNEARRVKESPLPLPPKIDGWYT